MLQSVGELVHSAFRFVGAHIGYVVRVFVAGSFFQHVCGSSEPVSEA